MIGKHCGTSLDTMHDGCLKVVKRCRICKTKFTQRKRQPVVLGNLNQEACTWNIPCDDHPKR